jgi:hypothetical protein
MFHAPIGSRAVVQSGNVGKGNIIGASKVAQNWGFTAKV